MSAQIKSNLPKRMKGWTTKIQPGKQFDVAAALRTRVVQALLGAGITVAAVDAASSG